MDKNNIYFTISGLLSLSLFTLILILFFMMLFSKTKVNTFALNKNNYVSISLEKVAIQSVTPTKTAKIKKEVSSKIEEVKEVEKVDIDSLFSDVWTKDVKIEKKVLTKISLELIQKKIKKSEDNNVKSMEKVLENDEAERTNDVSKKSSSGDEVNEYLAKIQAIVYKYFQPPANSQGYTVKTVIELSAYGKVLDFRILTYSDNQSLNKECDMIKERLIGVLFPSNPQNTSFKTIINITSDK